MKLRISAVAMACAFLALAIPTAKADCDNNGRCIETQRTSVAAHRGHRVKRDANGNEARVAAARGYCHVHTAGGEITIACHLVERMKGFIADVVARGFRGRIKCFSQSRSHVPGSLHFIAEACDFAQRGWGKTVAPMYRVADLARKWGLRDGCTFRDCGHIDSGRGLARVPWPARMAEMKARSVRR